MSEQELDRLSGTRLQLEMQVTTLESANLNAETLGAMKKASDALKVIHGNMCVIPLGYRSHPVPAMCLFHQRSRARVALPRVKGLFAVLGLYLQFEHTLAFPISISLPHTHGALLT